MIYRPRIPRCIKQPKHHAIPMLRDPGAVNQSARKINRRDERFHKSLGGPRGTLGPRGYAILYFPSNYNTIHLSFNFTRPYPTYVNNTLNRPYNLHFFRFLRSRKRMGIVLCKNIVQIIICFFVMIPCHTSLLMRHHAWRLILNSPQ